MWSLFKVFIEFVTILLLLLFFNVLIFGQEICGTFGEGNDTPLQYSCLENPMDGGAW